MTTRIEITNEGPADVEIRAINPETRGSNIKRILRPHETDSFLYVYYDQEIIIKEKI